MHRLPSFYPCSRTPGRPSIILYSCGFTKHTSRQLFIWAVSAERRKTARNSFLIKWMSAKLKLSVHTLRRPILKIPISRWLPENLDPQGKCSLFSHLCFDVHTGISDQFPSSQCSRQCCVCKVRALWNEFKIIRFSWTKGGGPKKKWFF